MALHQQQQTERLVAVGVVGKPHITTNNRLNTRRARGFVKLDHAEHVRQIGQRQGRHAVGGGGGNRIVNAHDAVNDGIFAV